MKKPSPGLFLRQRRKALWCIRRRRKAATRTHGPTSRRFVRPIELIVAPKRVDITQGGAPVVTHFIAAIAYRVLRLKLPVKLDFRATEQFYPAGTVLLFAELDRIVASAEIPKPVTIIEPRLRKPREVLKQVGMFALTGDNCDVVPSYHDVVYWRASKGATASGDEMSGLEAVADHVNRSVRDRLNLAQIWRGVSEAVANSVEHAYLVPRTDGFTGLPSTRWWMFSQLRGQTFTVAVCDLGCGYSATIARSIPEAFIADMLRLLRLANPDARAIQTAMEFGRSRTKDVNRGKGSRDALTVLKTHGNGELFVASNTGWVRYQVENGGDPALHTGDLASDIRATIVWWKLVLAEAIGDSHGDDQRRAGLH